MSAGPNPSPRALNLRRQRNQHADGIEITTGHRIARATEGFGPQASGEWQFCTLHNGGRFLTIEQNDFIKSGMSGFADFRPSDSSRPAAAATTWIPTYKIACCHGCCAKWMLSRHPLSPTAAANLPMIPFDATPPSHRRHHRPRSRSTLSKSNSRRACTRRALAACH